MTTTQVNVRVEPSISGTVLGIIPANTAIEIIGKDPQGSWWQINYPAAADGKGWVTAQYVTVTATPDVPTIGGTPTATSTSTPQSGNVAIVQQQLNVRSGPGTGFNSLGTLNPQDVVGLIGKDPNGAWLQINYENGPEGKGWINAAFVRAQGVENLPIVTETGQIVGTGTPTSAPPTPTPTLVPAWDDQDSLTNPIASVVFESTGTQTLIYSGDISSPQGDQQDWIAFRPYDRSVFLSVECGGSGTVEIELLENSSQLPAYIKCNAPPEEVIVKPDMTYLVHLRATAPTDALQYSNYTLTIKSRP
jgi:N-acetylmuramoyl-L-alanine amidase